MDLSTCAEITCLYVEDEEDSREVLASILARIFKTVLIAENGREGVELFRKNKPDMVITDIRMPVMDGLQMVKEMFQLVVDTKVIVTSAHSDASYLMDAIELGIDHYVLKPINLDKLYAAIAKCAEVISISKALEEERRQKDALIQRLSKSLEEIQTLRGILPICSYCKKIRNDDGYYEQIEAYIHKHSGVDFSHTVCPACMEKHYPEEYALLQKKYNR